MFSPTPSSRSPSPPPLPFSELNPRPDLPPGVAAAALSRLVSFELTRTGFESAERDALEDLEGLLYEFIDQLLAHSHDLANLGRRTQPHFGDLLQSVQELGLGGVAELMCELDREERDGSVPALEIKYDKPPRDPFVPTLASDDEEVDTDEEFFPLSPSPPPPPPLLDMDGNPLPALPELPPLPRLRKRRPRPTDSLEADWLPSLPPKHSYKQTPVFPQSRIPPTIPQSTTLTQQAPSELALRHLSTLRSRLNDSQLVASSLRNLIRRTRVGGGGAGEGREMAVVEGDEEVDVVNYEGELPAPSMPAAASSKRSIMLMRVGDEGKVELEGAGWGLENEGPGGGVGIGGSEGQRGEGGGGVGKRRKWRA